MSEESAIRQRVSYTGNGVASFYLVLAQELLLAHIYLTAD